MNSPTSRVKTATIAFGSPPRPPRAGRSPGGCGLVIPTPRAPLPTGTVQPVTITSEYAEIIYFLRNGNLYRRVLLIAPQLQSSIVQAYNNLIYNPATGTYSNNFTPQPGLNGNATSWLGVNDLSAHPAPSGNTTINGGQTIVLNTLGMLTNRENRAFAPRFANDFWDMTQNFPTGAVGSRWHSR